MLCLCLWQPICYGSYIRSNCNSNMIVLVLLFWVFSCLRSVKWSVKCLARHIKSCVRRVLLLMNSARLHKARENSLNSEPSPLKSQEENLITSKIHQLRLVVDLAYQTPCWAGSVLNQQCSYLIRPIGTISIWTLQAHYWIYRLGRQWKVAGPLAKSPRQRVV